MKISIFSIYMKEVSNQGYIHWITKNTEKNCKIVQRAFLIIIFLCVNWSIYLSGLFDAQKVQKNNICLKAHFHRSQLQMLMLFR